MAAEVVEGLSPGLTGRARDRNRLDPELRASVRELAL